MPTSPPPFNMTAMKTLFFALRHLFSAKPDLVLAVLCVGLMACSIPPLAWPLFSYIALVPLFLLIFRGKPRSILAFSFLAGIGYYSAHLYWIIRIDIINRYTFCVIILFLAAFFPLFSALGKVLHEKLPGFEPLTFPLLWVALEYLKTNVGFLSIPYGILGYSQYKLIPVTAIASYTGVYGVSFAIVAVNAALAVMAWHRRIGDNSRAFARHTRLVSIGMLFLVTGTITCFAISGSSWQSTVPVTSLKIAVAQGNAIADQNTGYDQYIREVLPIYDRLTVQAAAAGSPLVIWPAGSVPGILPLDKQGLLDAVKVATRNNVHLLFGAAGIDKFSSRQVPGRLTNSSFLVSPEGRLAGRYDKMHLVPFEEFIPLRRAIQWPAWMVNRDKKDHAPGKNLTLFTIGTLQFGVQICFDNMFPEQVRELVARGADFVVGHTNEFYAKSAAARYQNLSFTVFRAVENRVPFIRSSGNGISCIIDGNGRIMTRVQDESGREIDVAGLAIADIRTSTGRSFYNRFGDIFAAGCAASSLLLLAASRLFGGTVQTRGATWI